MLGNVIYLVVGLFLGAALGTLTLALLAVGKQADTESELLEDALAWRHVVQEATARGWRYVSAPLVVSFLPSVQDYLTRDQ